MRESSGEILEYINSYANLKDEKIPTEWLEWIEKQGEPMLNADEVIAWLVANICDYEYYVKRFKKDFAL